MDKSISQIALAIALVALVVLISVPAFSWKISGDSEARYQGVTNGNSNINLVWVVDTKTGQVKSCFNMGSYVNKSYCTEWINEVYNQ
jgi:hypothetical protein